MTVAMLGSPMAKKGRPKKIGGEGTQVRIDSDVIAKARYLAAQADCSLTEYLSSMLRPQIELAFKKAGKDLLGEA
jgi:hypothetical protein